MNNCWEMTSYYLHLLRLPLPLFQFLLLRLRPTWWVFWASTKFSQAQKHPDDEMKSENLILL